MKAVVETMVGPVAHAIVGYSGGVWPPEQSRHREDWSMSESTTIRYVGLDVHKDSIAIAVASSDGKPAESLGAVPNDIPALIKRLLRLGPAASLRCCYEAGPTGFGLARRLREAGIGCDVIAPSLVPVPPGVRVKTDRRGAGKAPGDLRPGHLT